MLGDVLHIVDVVHSSGVVCGVQLMLGSRGEEVQVGINISKADVWRKVMER